MILCHIWLSFLRICLLIEINFNKQIEHWFSENRIAYMDYVQYKFLIKLYQIKDFMNIIVQFLHYCEILNQCTEAYIHNGHVYVKPESSWVSLRVNTHANILYSKREPLWRWSAVNVFYLAYQGNGFLMLAWNTWVPGSVVGQIQDGTLFQSCDVL